MFDKEKFVKDFVEAAEANDEDKMTKLSSSVGELEPEERVTLLDSLLEKLKGSKAKEELVKYLEEIQSTLKFLVSLSELNKDSVGEEAKDAEVSKAEEVTEEVAANTNADEEDVIGDTSESGGYAPAEEEKEEKTESGKGE